ncbi:alpha-arabinofuranosidase [Bombiscardovia apis]|uniref:Alpha-arabinofuranosidase n=1 Tax=Bombiscardovia apis TaxID=2932182 RepID=A0ABN6SL27_9BIFI|nr:family 43 glycosylhydrolase [Bombiscardovia apis]BDR55261.1 alpha-arabinofuranosidase [Bombiscardovia apis]
MEATQEARWQGSEARNWSLLCYTRRPTSREEANNADVALSMHLALRSPLDGAWHPLNDNYGIFFAAGVPVDGVTNSARAACSAARRFPPEPKTRAATNPGLAGHDQAASESASVSPAVGWDAVMPGIDITLKSLIDPWLFRLADGRFGIAATRTDREGVLDGSQRDSFLLAVSYDLRSFDRLGQVYIDGAQGVYKPRVLWDSASSRYLVFFNNDKGALACAAMPEIAAAGEHPLVMLSMTEALAALDPSQDLSPSQFAIADVEPSNVMAISQREAAVLKERFGRIYNTTVSVEPVQLQTGAGKSIGEQLAHVRAQLSYCDGSTARRYIDVDRGQVAALESDLVAGKLESGSRRLLRAKIRQQTYPVPFARERADPSVFPYTWRGHRLFLFIATEDEAGNCVDPRGGNTHMPLRVAETIAGLCDEAGGREREIDLLKRGDLNSEGRPMTGCFWAPELHIIGGRLSILFMPCFDGDLANPDGMPNERAGKPDMWTGSCHIMQLKQDELGQDLDPREPANWDAPRPITRADGSPLNPVQRISLDMTVFEDSGTWYYAWQQVGSVWIARFDPAQPERLTSEPRQIVVPEFAWDNMIAEGPNVIAHDGLLYLIYSGSLVGIDYTTGLVTAPAGQGADLCNPTSWTKLDYPAQKSSIYNGSWQLGTGHGMWSQDEDGNQLYVFHNAEYSGGEYGGRDAQVRRIHWSQEGMPVLDMQCSEELDPANAQILVEVNV